MPKQKNLFGLLILLPLLGGLLAACDSTGAGSATPEALPKKEAGTVQPVEAANSAPAGGYRAWLVSDLPKLVLTLPPAGPVLLAPLNPGPDKLKKWANPVNGWLDTGLEVVRTSRYPVTRASRSLALLAVGFNDSLLAAEQSRQRGLNPSEAALLATVSRQILVYVYPAMESVLDDEVNVAKWVDVWNGTASPENVETGVRLGNAVVGQILDYASKDGGEAAYNRTIPPIAPGIWQPTAPDYEYPVDPEWGKVKPIGLSSELKLLLPPPPAWDSAEFKADRENFLQVQRNLTQKDRDLAQKWAGAAGTVSPPGLWFQTARELAGRDNLGPRESARIYAALGLTMHNTTVADWQNKYQYMVARPIQWMNDIDPAWHPEVKTPPFPSFPSGHSTLSAGASLVLIHFFPGDRTRLEQDAREASYSRVVGGIHWPMDTTRGFDLGLRIGEDMVKKL